MIHFSKIPSAREIRESGAEGPISKSFRCDEGHMIIFGNGVVFAFDDGHTMRKAFRKLVRMGFERDLNLQSDEHQGLAEADPKTAFNFKVIG